MPKIITEDMIEKAAINLLLSEYASSYKNLYCYTEKPETLPDSTGRTDKRQVVLSDILLKKLTELNPAIPEETIKQTVSELFRISHNDPCGDPLGDNYHRYQQIRNGIAVKFKKDKRETHALVRLIDFDHPENNSFITVSQMWIRGEVHWRRPDLIIFVNGLPLVFIELKNSNINVKNAYDKNLTDYRRDIPWLFTYNQICVLSNGIETRLGGFSSGYEHFFEWLKTSDEKENPDRSGIREKQISLEYFIRGLCKPQVLLDYIENFVFFDQRKGNIIKSKIIVGNDEVRGEFLILSNTVHSLYESLRPDIFKMDFDPKYKEAILYLRGMVDGSIRLEKLEKAKEHINNLLDESVYANDTEYIISEKAREIDLSKINIDELREKFKHTKNRNLEISSLREHLEKKLQQMLRRNVTRANFAERFRIIIDSYNSGGSQNDDFYEKILNFMDELRAEEERHIKEELSEEELELFDLLRKDKLTKAEERKVKLAAKELYNTLTEKKGKLFIIGWQNDPQPRARVKAEIIECLNGALPDSYDPEIFEQKSSIVFEHIIDKANTGYAWVA